MHRVSLFLTLTIGLAASAASAAPLSLGVSAGPVAAVGEGSDQFDNGRSIVLETTSHGRAANAWMLRASYTEFSSATATFFNGGRFYVPTASGEAPLRQTSLETGLTREFGAHAIRPRLEGLVGAAWTEQRWSSSTFINDRRPDPAGPSAGVSSHLVPSLAMGAGVQVAVSDNLGLDFSAAARWLPTDRLNGLTIPVRVGATWMGDRPEAAEVAAPAHGGPRLKLTSGLAFLQNPARLRGEMKPSAAFAVEVEQPMGRGLSWSLAGEHIAQRDDVPVVTRQELDQSGNLVDVAWGSVPLSATATVATLGVRGAHAWGPVALSLRGGAGWGRTGGFGTREMVVAGYVVDGGNLIPVQQAVDHGVGDSATGFAYSGTLAAEARLGGRLSAVAESGVLGLHLEPDDVLAVPVRLGLVLR